jgi:phospholipase/carboxylesterase
MKLESELIPANEPRPDGKRAMMVMMHGLGDSVDGYRWLPEAMAVPWLDYLLVNAPDDYYGGFSWFDLDIMAPGIERSRQLLFNLLDELQAQGTAPEQITVGGFSQGCLMAMEIALRYPHLLAGVVGISGWIFEEKKILRQLSPVAQKQRILMTHGTFDPVVPITQVKPQIAPLKAAGINVEWHELAKEHTIAGEQELSLIRNFVCAGYPVVGK